MKYRIEALDYLRGVLAASVMLYHYYSWSGSPQGAGVVGSVVHDLLYKLGIYGVCSFYVLSGISLGYVYREMTLDRVSLRDFAIKRFFRIAPLYWLASLLALAIPVAVYLFRGDGTSLPSATTLVLNFSLLFSFVAPTEYIPVGGWSIGNELTFYAAFPLLVLGLRRGGLVAVLALVAAILPGVYVAFLVMTPRLDLSSQWAIYVNPLNHFFLFAAGVGIARLHGVAPSLSGRKASLALLVLLVAFVIYPLGGHQIAIVTGGARLYFSAICLAAGAVCLLMRAEVPRPLHVGLSLLGATSYSVYLLHSVVFAFVRRGLGLLEVGNAVAVVAASIPLTLVFSYLSYQHVERRLMRTAKRFTSPAAPASVTAAAAAP